MNDTLFAKAFKGLRPFAMSRSTFAGSGAFGGHFFGDND
jgi:alpha-glucosidase (family GH31 glycosyl hydrolase)